MVFKVATLSLFWLSLVAKPAGLFLPWGNDADLESLHSKESSIQAPCINPLKKTAQTLIGLHQRFFTKTTGPRSHFRPTSSQYALTAIQTYGFFQGFCMGCDRLLRENNDLWVYRTCTVQDWLYKFEPASIE